MAKPDDLDWDDLRYFLRALQARTIAGGARSLGVEHSTLGRRLSALERALGASLVLRSPDGLRLTPLGEKMTPLIEELELTVGALRELVASERKRVRLATPSGFAKLLSEGLPQLAKEHPEISLEIVSGARPVDLRKGEADLAIRGGPIADQDLMVRKLCDSGFSLYASEAYLARRSAPVDLNDLSGHEIIGFDLSLSQTPAAKWVAEHAAGAAIVLRTREMTDVLSAALGGVGVAVLPCLLGDQENGLRRLTPEVVATHPLSMVYRREARIARPVDAVMRWAAAVMRQNAGRIGGRSSVAPRQASPAGD